MISGFGNGFVSSGSNERFLICFFWAFGNYGHMPHDPQNWPHGSSGTYIILYVSNVLRGCTQQRIWFGTLFNLSNQQSTPTVPGSYPFFVVAIPVWVSSRISGGLTPLRRVDFLPFEKLNFFEIMLSKFPQFSTEQLLETSESEDPDFLGTSSLSAQNPGA